MSSEDLTPESIDSPLSNHQQQLLQQQYETSFSLDPADIDRYCPAPPTLRVEETCVFSWHINDYKSLLEKDREYSPTFTFGNTTWRLLLFPKGNRNPNIISIFLDNVDSHNLDINDKFHVCASFGLSIQSPNDETSFIFQTATHRFCPKEPDWGFNSLINLIEAGSPKAPKFEQSPQNTPTIGTINYGWKTPLIKDNKTVFKVYIKKLFDESGCLWHRFDNWDSKTETGFVGLKNQGATCYMNSLLQSLYFTNYYRRATFQIPTENDSPTNSIPLALQRIFYNLEYSNDAVSTNELTKSFGWDAMDSFMQHDVQEFNRVLQDSLETKMKGTRAEGAISKLFVGKTKSYIKCINVDFESSRTEDFYDIQLNVKDCADLKDSFKNYIEEEILDGDNKYMAEGHGLQDAKKGVVFTSFPPVLHLQLKRFEYDMMRDTMVKINDRHEFLPEIDLAPYLDAEANNGENYNYILHGVLVHSGDLSGGHYCAFIKPDRNNKWYKFDDDRVIPATKAEVYDENFGGFINNNNNNQNSNTKAYRRNTNAYMLVYVRESHLDQILSPITIDDIPEHLRIKMKEEREHLERINRERGEAHLYQSVRVVSDAEIGANTGFDLCNFADRSYIVTDVESNNKDDNSDVVSYEPGAGIPIFKVKKKDTLLKFKSTLEHVFGIPASSFNLWLLVGRQNKTIRPDHPLSNAEENLTMEAILETYSKICSDLKFYIEDTRKNDPRFGTIGNSLTAPNNAFMYFKYFDVETGVIKYLGGHIINRNGTIAELFPLICRLVGLSTDTKLRAYEEVKPTMIDLLTADNTVLGCELGNGDIICFQKDILKDENLPYNGVVTYYYDYLLNRISVILKDKNNDKMEPICLVLSKKSTYDEVTKELANVINSKISYNSITPNGNSPLLTNARTPGHDNSNLKSLNSSPISETKDHNPSTISEQYKAPINARHISLWPFQQYSSRIVNRFSKKSNLEVMVSGSLTRRQDTKINELPTGTILYEVLDIDADELENKKLIKISYLEINDFNSKIKEYPKMDIIISPQSSAADLIKAIKVKLGFLSGDEQEITLSSDSMDLESINEAKRKKLSEDNRNSYNEYLLVIGGHRIEEYIDLHRTVNSIPDYKTIQLHKYPKLVEGEKTIEIFQYSKDINYKFGTPFFLNVKKGETYDDIKHKISKLLDLNEKELQKSKINILNNNLVSILNISSIDNEHEATKPVIAQNNNENEEKSSMEIIPNIPYKDLYSLLEELENPESDIKDGPYSIGIDHQDKSTSHSRSGLERGFKILS